LGGDRENFQSLMYRLNKTREKKNLIGADLHKKDGAEDVRELIRREVTSPNFN